MFQYYSKDVQRGVIPEEYNVVSLITVFSGDTIDEPDQPESGLEEVGL